MYQKRKDFVNQRDVRDERLADHEKWMSEVLQIKKYWHNSIKVVDLYQTFEEEQVASMDALQRAAGGGIAVGRTGGEWASEGELKDRVGEPENRLR